jgi:hypothetical protein
MDPDSNFIILEQLAQARDQTSWNALMAPALAQLIPYMVRDCAFLKD